MKNEHFFPVYFFVSSESLLLNEALEEVNLAVLHLVDPSWDLFNFDAKNCDLNQVVDALSGFPLGNSLRLIKVSNCQLLSKEQVSQLEAYLRSPLISSVLILSGDKLGNCSTLKKVVGTVGKFEQIIRPKANTLPNWVIEKAKAFDKTMKVAAAVKLIELAGEDLQTLFKEIEKLSLGASGNELTVKDVVQSASNLPQAKIFELIDLIIEKKSVKAFQLLSPVIADSGALGLIELLKRRYRQLVEVKTAIAKDNRLSSAALAKEFSLHPFVAEKLKKQSFIYEEVDLVRIFNVLLSAEMNIKTGIEPSFSIENLIQEISQKQRSAVHA